MTGINIFDFKSYKTFLQSALHQRSRTERGIRSRLAEFIRCHTAYVSQVLNGEAHFSLEQAELVAKFLTLNKSETNCLLILVQYERAGTQTLKEYFLAQLKDLANKQHVLKERLEFNRTLSREDQATFYSAWYYGAIHVLVSLPGRHTEKGIAEYLQIPLAKVIEVLEFLTRLGLVIKTQDGFQVGTSHIHLEHDSPMISKHHTNWRMRAIQSLDLVTKKDLHYSSVITCSKEDAEKIKTTMVKTIEAIRAIVRPSQDEVCFAYCLDLFQLGGDE